MKLSPAQQRVMDILNEPGVTAIAETGYTVHSGWWKCQNSIWFRIRLNANTIFALYNRGLIERKLGMNVSGYPHASTVWVKA